MSETEQKTPRELVAIARRFHETYERLAPSFDYTTRPESAVLWENVPEKNRALMVAVVCEVVGPIEEDRGRMRDNQQRLVGRVTMEGRYIGQLEHIAKSNRLHPTDCDTCDAVRLDQERQMNQ